MKLFIVMMNEGIEGVFSTSLLANKYITQQKAAWKRLNRPHEHRFYNAMPYLRVYEYELDKPDYSMSEGL